jgi:hypothetical protein
MGRTPGQTCPGRDLVHIKQLDLEGIQKLKETGARKIAGPVELPG